MKTHRLELFSDGVFAIVLTLLVLDLKLPSHLGVAGFLEVAPALMVHAATFGLVGYLWITHHNTVAMVKEVHPVSLALNVLALFWLTLMPFTAKVAAANPMDSLGPSGIAACLGLWTASTVVMRLTMHGPLDDVPEVRRWLDLRLRQYAALAAVRLILAALAWVSPWFGYATFATVLVGLLFGPTPPLPATLVNDSEGSSEPAELAAE